MTNASYIENQVTYFKNSCQAKADKLGVEMEHLLVDKDTLRSYSYYEKDGQKDVVEKLMKRGWTLFLEEEGYPLGIVKDGTTITFEPGGQFEFSLKPLKSVAEVARVYRDVLTDVHCVLQPNQALVSVGYHPKTTIAELPLLPKKRYQMMYDYFKTHGAKCHNMMKGSAATQVSIDFTSEEDFIKKFRVAHFLAPVLSALFDATPIFEGALYEKANARVAIWQETDLPRSKLVPGVLDKRFGFADYAEYLLGVAPILIKKGDAYYYTADDTLETILTRETFNNDEQEHLQSMVFPDARLKKYIEIRMADAMPFPYNMAVVAAVETLFYQDDVLDAAYALSLEVGDDWVKAQNIGLTQMPVQVDERFRTLKKWVLETVQESIKPESRAYWMPFLEIVKTHGSVAGWLKKVYSGGTAEFLKAIDVTSLVGVREKMIETVVAHTEAHVSDYHQMLDGVAHSKAIYKGEPVPTLYVPMVYTERDEQTFKQALGGMMDVVRRTIDLYLEKPDVRALFDFDEKLDALIRVPHQYDAHVPMGRFDIFYYGDGDFRFCELNADGASAMNEQYELAKVFEQTALLKSFGDRYQFETHELFHSWVHSVSEIYKSYQANRGFEKARKDTHVAIVDFVDKSSPIEFEVFKAAFIAEGYRCDIVDPRDIVCEDGKMVKDGQVIDVVYRRLVTKDLMDRYDEIPGFVEGLRAGETCVIGSVKTQIVHTKRFFEVLYRPEFRQYLSAAQIAFIDAHIPMTKRLTNAPDYIVDKDAYIIKPVDYYASKGVCAGSDYTEAEWAELIREKSAEDFIVQRYCPLSLQPNVLYNETSGFERHLFRTITGLFTYNEKLSGVYVRAGLNAIISGLHSGYTLPTFIVKEK